MTRPGTSSNRRLPRKTVEKHRRILMKTLCFKMASLIPDHYLPQPKEFLSQQDQLEHSIAYIEISKGRLEELRRRKARLMKADKMMDSGTNKAGDEPKLQPTLTVRDFGSGVEVILVTGLEKGFRLSDVISIIEQEAAEVHTVGVSKQLDKVLIHTIHAQVRISRVGVDAARISERIHELISSV